MMLRLLLPALTAAMAAGADGPGALTRVAFVIRRHKIVEWRRVPDAPGARLGPARPEPAPPAGQSIT